ncbi:SatD family protein [Faecalicatena sp. AGMB00832]|uniref:SatD family protein n=1 Tax=Faecalicatena faecalis TaxID=2726362 RepID=A0ABS6D7H4_9FIRM|nr:SatD family protein [Faecalicatena faecalis]MBU3877552.1 SatD family protein [Faecalicatena faecalis]
MIIKKGDAMTKYVSLIIDIENSRGYNVQERNAMQEFMIDCIKRLNVLFSGAVQFEVTFSAGDEVQGLFRDVTSAVLYLRLFEMLIRPVKIRAGIGVGEWNVKIEDGLSTEQDGPVYHRARQAIEEVYKKQTQRYRICSENDDDLLNHLLNSSCTLKEQQGYMQNIAFIIMELLYPFTKSDFVLYKHDIITELLKIKYEYKIGKRNGYQTGRPLYTEDLDTCLHGDVLYVVDPINIDGNSFESEEVIIKKNMSSNIAEVLGCKRQNADMLIKRGNSIAIRAMDYIALQYIEREQRMYGI